MEVIEAMVVTVKESLDEVEVTDLEETLEETEAAA
jgi:hypothetical protein